MFLTDDVTITGQLAAHAYTAASGKIPQPSRSAPPAVPRSWRKSPLAPQFRTMRVGFLQPPHDLTPQMVIWTNDARIGDVPRRP